MPRLRFMWMETLSGVVINKELHHHKLLPNQHASFVTVMHQVREIIRHLQQIKKSPTQCRRLFKTLRQRKFR